MSFTRYMKGKKSKLVRATLTCHACSHMIIHYSRREINHLGLIKARFPSIDRPVSPLSLPSIRSLRIFMPDSVSKWPRLTVHFFLLVVQSPIASCVPIRWFRDDETLMEYLKSISETIARLSVVPYIFFLNR